MGEAFWGKLTGDLRSLAGRLLVLAFTVGLGVLVLTALSGAASSLLREMGRSYEATNPATATLEADAPVPADQIGPLIQGMVADASLADSVVARFLDGGGRWQPLVLFVVPDLATARIARVFPEPGTPWPPVPRTVALERTAATTFGLLPGQGLRIRWNDGREAFSPTFSVVHDPAVAPAYQERTAYAYADEATARAWGLTSFHQVKLRLDPRLDWNTARAEAVRVGTVLQSRGIALTGIEVPPVHQHPHQGILVALLAILGAFGALTVVLCSVLVSNVIAALIARERRWIGVMKTLGATGLPIAGLFLTPVLLLGLVAVAWALPLGLLLSIQITAAVGQLLNLRVTDLNAEAWAAVGPGVFGVALPLLMASGPVARAVKMSILHSLSDVEVVAGERKRRRGPALPLPASFQMAWRNLGRKRGRLVLSLLLLGVGGGLFLTAANLSWSWKELIAESLAGRRMDYQVRLLGSRPDLTVPAALAPGVKSEAWLSLPATTLTDQKVPVEATYPDEAHGSFRLYALPVGTEMVAYPLQAGRWLGRPGEVVLNQGAMARFPGTAIGSKVRLRAGGEVREYTLVGVVREVGQASAYVAPEPWAPTDDLRTELLVAQPGGHAPSLGTALDRWLTGTNLPVEVFLDSSEYEIAGNEHFGLLTVLLFLMGLATGLVGWLGIASILGLAVLERRREYGIVRSLGATPGDVRLTIAGEAVLMTTLGTLVSLGAAYPLTVGLGAFLGSLALRTPIPAAVDGPMVLVWLAVSLLAGVAASLNAGSLAARTTIRETLVLN